MDYQKELQNLLTLSAGMASGYLIAQGWNAAFAAALVAFALAWLNNRMALLRERQKQPDPTKPIVPTGGDKEGSPGGL